MSLSVHILSLMRLLDVCFITVYHVMCSLFAHC